MGFLAKTKPSNTVKVAMWALAALMAIVVAVIGLVALGAHYLVDPQVMQSALEALMAIGSGVATLGGAATLAKGGRDAVADYSKHRHPAPATPVVVSDEAATFPGEAP